MLYETNKEKGRAGMAMGIAWFASNGYTVSIPLNDTQWYDFIAEKEGNFYSVQCKATGSADGTISLRSTGGTKGITYERVNDNNIDYLFCLNQNQDMFVIPGEVLRSSGNINSIKLRTEPTKNNQGLQTYQYLVKI